MTPNLCCLLDVTPRNVMVGTLCDTTNLIISHTIARAALGLLGRYGAV